MIKVQVNIKAIIEVKEILKQMKRARYKIVNRNCGIKCWDKIKTSELYYET